MSPVYAPSPQSYSKAVNALRTGQIIALPTETVYGVAACAHMDSAVLDMFKLKHRNTAHPISLCVFSARQAQTLCHVSPLAKRLMRDFWPGALTLVLPRKKHAKISAHLSPLPTLGLRCPAIEWRQGFIDLGFTTPLALSSANTAGQPSPVHPKQIEMQITKALPFILDGGACQTALDSTVVSVEHERLRVLRLGAIAPERFAPYPIDWAQV